MFASLRSAAGRHHSLSTSADQVPSAASATGLPSQVLAWCRSSGALEEPPGKEATFCQVSGLCPEAAESVWVNIFATVSLRRSFKEV